MPQNFWTKIGNSGHSVCEVLNLKLHLKALSNNLTLLEPETQSQFCAFETGTLLTSLNYWILVPIQTTKV